MKELTCPTCKCVFVCHRLAVSKRCPDMSKDCECDKCDPSRHLDHDCHTLLKGKPFKEVVIFT